MDRTTDIRLHVDADLAAGGDVALAPGQAHYVRSVMRLGTGSTLLLFNGRDGEWRARIESLGKGRCGLRLVEPTRPQRDEADLWLVFAPLKRGRIDYLAQKATELGVALLQPVLTAHTAVARVNTRRLAANAVEAAEQCGRLTVPAVREPAPLERILADWPPARRLLVCDETGAAPPMAQALAEVGQAAGQPWAVLIGPEGGFAETELDALRNLPFVTPVGLGPRVLRADTAALAALALWQALVGTWSQVPSRSGPQAG